MGDRPSRSDVTVSYGLGVEMYERLWSPVILPGAVALIPRLELQGGDVILDVGAGTGVLGGAIRDNAPSTQVFALDASHEMLRIAHLERGQPSVLADAASLPARA